MGLKTSIIGQPTDSHVTVEAKYNKNYSRYFYVDKNNADSFQKEISKNNNKQYWISTAMLFAAIMTAITIPGLIIKDKSKQVVKIITEIITGLALGLGASRISYEINTKSEKKLLDSFDAKEIKMNQNA